MEGRCGGEVRRGGVEGERSSGEVHRGAAEGTAMRGKVQELKISTSSMPRALHTVTCP